MATASPVVTSDRVLPAGNADDAPWSAGITLREIAGGGLAGLVAGILVAGFGGRVAMRLAAMAVPDATGMFTANGNQIGDITADGTLALVVFVGLFAGLVGGVLWVTIRPWMPAAVLPRAVLAMPVAVALGSSVLIEPGNPDFRILDHSAVVVSIMVGLVALFGLVIAAVEAFLQRRLPPARVRSRAAIAYAVLTIIGLTLGAPLILPAFLAGRLAPVGLALVVTGCATLAWWYQRSDSRTQPPRAVAVAGRGGLIASVALGLWFAVPVISASLGMD